MAFKVNTLNSIECLGTAFQVTPIEGGRVFLDLNNEVVLSKVGRLMELSSRLESMQRWLWNTKIGRCFGGEKRIFKMAQEKITELLISAKIPLTNTATTHGFKLTKTPQNNTAPNNQSLTSLEKGIQFWITTSLQNNFRISIKGDQFTIINYCGGTLSGLLSGLQIPEDSSLQERLQQLAPDCEFTLLVQNPAE